MGGFSEILNPGGGGGSGTVTNGSGAGTAGTIPIWNSATELGDSKFSYSSNVMSLINATNAQRLDIYNTFTSSTNNELGKFSWETNVLRIGTVKGSGGGTARALALATDNTNRVTIAADGTTATLAGGTALVFTGSGSGTATVAVPAAAGTPTVTLPTVSMTLPTAQPATNGRAVVVSTAGVVSYATGVPTGSLFLRDDGAYAAAGSSITGTDTHVMFFDGANTPAGEAGFVYDKTTDIATLAGGLTFGSAGVLQWSTDALIVRGAAATIQLGATAGTATNYTLKAADSTTAATNGATLTIAAGDGATTGTSGTIDFQTSGASAALTTRVQVRTGGQLRVINGLMGSDTTVTAVLDRSGSDHYFEFASTSGGIRNSSATGIAAKAAALEPLFGTSTGAYDVGASTVPWRSAFIQTSIQGTRTKALTDATATAFVRIANATSNTAVGGHVDYTVVAIDSVGNTVQAESGTLYFVVVNEGGTVTALVMDDSANGTNGVGMARDAAAGTFNNTFDTSIATTNCDLRVTSDTSLTTTTHKIEYRVVITSGTAAVTPQ